MIENTRCDFKNAQINTIISVCGEQNKWSAAKSISAKPKENIEPTK